MTEETFDPDDAIFADLFAEAGWDKLAQAPPNERRIEEITKRAISETVMKESTSFLFLGFSAALSGIFCSLFGGVTPSDEDYKP